MHEPRRTGADAAAHCGGRALWARRAGHCSSRAAACTTRTPARRWRSSQQRFGVAVAETQAGKGALRFDHPCNVGAIGVTGSAAANALAAEADLVMAIGTRLQDFTTGSAALFADPAAPADRDQRLPPRRVKYGALHLQGDALRTLEELRSARRRRATSLAARIAELAAGWHAAVDRATADDGVRRPTDAQVLGAVNRWIGPKRHRGLRGRRPAGRTAQALARAGRRRYHLEYGYSCMGYEIAGGLGVKLARPERDVVVLVGDGSYLMMNSEIATSVALGLKLVIVVLDNRGFGCINRLQRPAAASRSTTCSTTRGSARRRRFRGARARARRGRRARDGHRRRCGSARRARCGAHRRRSS